MPHITQHAPKVLTRSVYPCARESLRERLQQDRHTDRLSKTTFLDVLKVIHPKSGVILNSIFLHDVNTSIDREVKAKAVDY